MTDLEKAARQALEALATCQVAYPGTRFKSKDFTESTVQEAITALRTAIEQAEKQEPVAWQHRMPICDSQGKTLGYSDWKDGKGLDWWPHRALYTHSAPAAPVQEPLKEATQKAVVLLKTVAAGLESAIEKATPPAAQRQSARSAWVGLTPDEVFGIADQHPVEGFDPDIMAYTRAIEAKLREKNGGQL